MVHTPTHGSPTKKYAIHNKTQNIFRFYDFFSQQNNFYDFGGLVQTAKGWGA